MKNRILLSLILMGVLFWSCNRRKATEIEIISTAKIDTIKLEDGCRDVSFPATLRAASEVNLSFRVAGQIQKYYVKEGTFVTSGQIVAQMDPRDYQTQLSATQAEYDEIKSLCDRVTELYNRGSATKNDYEKATSGLQQITAKLNHHKNQLSDTRLLATSEGYVQKIIHNEGEIIGAGMPVVTIAAGKKLSVVVSLPANYYVERENFASFYAILTTHKKLKIPLEFSEIAANTKIGQSFDLTLKLPKSTDTLQLAAGMSAEVHIVYKRTEQQNIEIPISAVFEYSDSTFVWRYISDNEPLTLQHITISNINDAGKVIVLDGLKNGDMYVAAGVHSIKEAMKVRALR